MNVLVDYWRGAVVRPLYLFVAYVLLCLATISLSFYFLLRDAL